MAIHIVVQFDGAWHVDIDCDVSVAGLKEKWHNQLGVPCDELRISSAGNAFLEWCAVCSRRHGWEHCHRIFGSRSWCF